MRTRTNEVFKITDELKIALTLWFIAHDHEDITKPFRLGELIRCLKELGIITSPRRYIWRKVEGSNLENTFGIEMLFPYTITLCILCDTSDTWQESTERWIQDNRELLIAKKALTAHAPTHDILKEPVP